MGVAWLVESSCLVYCTWRYFLDYGVETVWALDHFFGYTARPSTLSRGHVYGAGTIFIWDDHQPHHDSLRAEIWLAGHLRWYRNLDLVIYTLMLNITSSLVYFILYRREQVAINFISEKLSGYLVIFTHPVPSFCSHLSTPLLIYDIICVMCQFWFPSSQALFKMTCPLVFYPWKARSGKLAFSDANWKTSHLFESYHNTF